MNQKILNFISRLRTPADRAAVAARFGISPSSIPDGIQASAAGRINPTPTPRQDGLLMSEADLAAEIAAKRKSLGMPAENGDAIPEGPANGVLMSEADLNAEIARKRRELGR